MSLTAVGVNLRPDERRLNTLTCATLHANLVPEGEMVKRSVILISFETHICGQDKSIVNE